MPSDNNTVILGMGSSSDVRLEELVLLADRVLASANFRRPDIIATIATKQDDPVWLELAEHYHCDLRFFDPTRLEEQTSRIKNPSEAVFKALGCHSVAEAAALAAAGAKAELLIEKTSSNRATAAIAVTRGL